jgi:hypothetical protein
MWTHKPVSRTVDGLARAYVVEVRIAFKVLFESLNERDF